QARAVEVRAPMIEVRAAHRLVERVDLDRHAQLALRAAKPPRRVVGLLGGERPPLTLAADRDDMTGELAKQIAARNPRRHSHALRRRRVVDGELDLEKMAARIEQPHTITNQRRASLSSHVREAAADAVLRGWTGGFSHTLANARGCSYRSGRRCSSESKGNAVRSCGCPRNCERRGFASCGHWSRSLGRPRETVRAVSQETCRRCRPSACRGSKRCGKPVVATTL